MIGGEFAISAVLVKWAKTLTELVVYRYNIDCANQPTFYNLNALLYQEPEEEE